MDCFFAAVEMRENPSLKNIPMAVGGRPDSRGVISTSNYPARKFGVKSGISSAAAMRLCPQLKILHHSFQHYKQDAQKIHAIFYEYTDQVEIAGLDEAYLDVTDCSLFGGSATLIARDIKKKIFEKTKLTASAGVAPNMFLAKVASDWKKPDGLFVIRPEEVADFVKDLAVKKIPGVGKVGFEKLKKMGVTTCSDLQKIPLEDLQLSFGKWAKSLHDKSFGRCWREICTHYERKSLSTEETFEGDLSFDELKEWALGSVVEEFQRRWEKHNKQEKIQTLFVKLKFCDFVNVSVQKNFSNYNLDEIYQHAEDLLHIAFAKGERPVRLLGIGVRFCQEKEKKESIQLKFPFI